MIEDPLYLPKDTRVFILTSAQKDSHIRAKQKLVAEFRVFGYNPTIQYYPTVNQVANHELGFELPVREKDVGLIGILQWYAYWSVLLKARKLEKHFIIAFSSVSNFRKDVPRSLLKRNLTSMGEEAENTDYFHVMNHVGAQNILNNDADTITTKVFTSATPYVVKSVIERKSVDIFTQAPDRLVFGK